MIVVYLVVFIWGRVIVGSNGDATTEIETSSLSPDLHTAIYLPNNEGITAINEEHEQFDMLPDNLKTDNADDFVQARNATEEPQNDEKEFNHADEDHSSNAELDIDKTTDSAIEANEEKVNEDEDGDVTDDPDIFEDNWDDIATDDVLNGSFNETAEDIFDIPNNETTDDLFGSSNNETNHETADDIFNGSNSGDLYNVSSLNHTGYDKSVEDIFNVTSNKSLNFSGILHAWISEQSTELYFGNGISEVPDPHLETAEEPPLFTATAFNSKGDVCISLNMSMQPLLNGTPLQLLPAYVSAESYSMNNGNITFHTADKDKTHNVTINFLIHCDQQSCGLELVSVYVRNLSSEEVIEAVNHDELCRTKLGTTFEAFNKKSLSMSDAVELQIPYISFFVLEGCVKDLDTENFISRYYVEVLCGLGLLILAVCVIFVIYRKIQGRNRSSFDTMM